MVAVVNVAVVADDTLRVSEPYTKYIGAMGGGAVVEYSKTLLHIDKKNENPKDLRFAPCLFNL